MLESGKAFRHLVQFLSGEPTSDLTYTLYNQDGGVVVTNTLTIPANSVSYVIEITGAQNTLTKPLIEKMRLEWSYNTSTEAILDEITYLIHLQIPFAVTQEGVREMLGVNSEELPDDEIDFLTAYVDFRQQVGDDTDLSSFENAGNIDSYRITKSIEAAAAMNVLSTLQIRLPRKYDSGTSSYERWNTIDWEGLAAKISDKFIDGILAVDPDYEPFPIITIFGLSDRGADPITGA